MLTIYLDTTVYDHIDKGYISPSEVLTLRAAIARGDIVGHLGVGNVEELLGQWKTDRGAAVRKLRLARDLFRFESLLKPPMETITDALRSYADGKPLPSPFLAEEQRRIVAPALTDVLDGGLRLSAAMSEMVEHVRRLKETFVSSMRERGVAIAARMLAPDAKGQYPSFEEYWAAMAVEFAAAFADRYGFGEACRLRGLEGLLAVRPVTLAVGGGMSLLYSNVVDGRHSRDSDLYDLWHAIVASRVNVLVTRDKGFARVLNRVRIEAFTVATSLSEVLGARSDSST